MLFWLVEFDSHTMLGSEINLPRKTLRWWGRRPAKVRNINNAPGFVYLIVNFRLTHFMFGAKLRKDYQQGKVWYFRGTCMVAWNTSNLVLESKWLIFTGLKWSSDVFFLNRIFPETYLVIRFYRPTERHSGKDLVFGLHTIHGTGAFLKRTTLAGWRKQGNRYVGPSKLYLMVFKGMLTLLQQCSC